MCSRHFVLFLGVLLCGCSISDDSPKISVHTASFDFNQSSEGWEADFADLPAGEGDSSFYELKFAHTNLPANLGNRKALMLSGNNHSDDLFMFLKTRITGLMPNTLYNIFFEVELASNAPESSVGVGGSPGKSVYLKAGAIGIEPEKTVESDHYVLNIDKGNQSTSGLNAIVLGDIAIPSSASDYTLISRNNASDPSFIGKTNNAGELWIIIGTDSGFEGVTTVYYTKVNIVFSAPY
jgi:hypothetical protein